VADSATPREVFVAFVKRILAVPKQDVKDLERKQAKAKTRPRPKP
jgi:hypothetical protein